MPKEAILKKNQKKQRNGMSALLQKWAVKPNRPSKSLALTKKGRRRKPLIGNIEAHSIDISWTDQVCQWQNTKIMAYCTMSAPLQVGDVSNAGCKCCLHHFMLCRNGS